MIIGGIMLLYASPIQLTIVLIAQLNLLFYTVYRNCADAIFVTNIENRYGFNTKYSELNSL